MPDAFVFVCNRGNIDQPEIGLGDQRAPRAESTFVYEEEG